VNRYCKVSAVALVAVAMAAVSAGAQAPFQFPHFSADVQIKGEKRGDSMSGKMYFGGQKWRMDMSAQGHNSSMIFDLPSKTAYMVMPEQKMYMEMRLDQQMPGAPKTPEFEPIDPKNPCAHDAEVTCTKVGTEVVNGRSTDKWVFTDRKGGERHTAWVDQKLGFPIRTVHSDGGSMELLNIKEGPQPASVFQVPAGFQKFDMGGMMKQR
jgi:hypothetical protein